jgi:hypothetical protein
LREQAGKASTLSIKIWKVGDNLLLTPTFYLSLCA